MKLRNKLIPIITLATATTAVAPIASSCSFSMDNVVSDTKDITSPFTPDIAKADKIEEKINESKALDIYMNHVMSNTETLKQDIWYYESKMLPGYIQQIEHTYVYFDGTEWIYGYDNDEKFSSVTDVTATINVNNVEINKHEAIVRAHKVEFYTISMTLGYEFDFKATSLATEPRVQLDQKISFQSTYKNVPLYMYHDDEWYVSVDLLSTNIDEYLMEIPGGWSFSYDINRDCTYDITSHGLNQKYEYQDSAKDSCFMKSQVQALRDKVEDVGYNDILNYLQYLDFASYHMSDVEGYSDQLFEFVPTGKSTAEVTYKKVDDGYEFTPVTDKFHLFYVPERFQKYWEFLSNFYFVYDYAQLMELANEDDFEKYGILNVNVPNNTSLTKSSNGYYLNTDTINVTNLNFDHTKLAEKTFTINFVIPAETDFIVDYDFNDEDYNKKYSDYDYYNDLVHNFTTYTDISFSIKFSPAE